MKKFNKVLAIVLTVFTLLSALPMSVFADAWLDVDANTNGSSSKVTVTVDAGALADILEKDGISTALLSDIKNGIAVDVSALKEAFTVAELLEIIPRESWLEIFDLDEIVDAIGIDNLEKYVDFSALLESVDHNTLIDLVLGLEDPMQVLDVESLVADGYISEELILKHADKDAVANLFDAKDIDEIFSAMTEADLKNSFNWQTYAKMMLGQIPTQFLPTNPVPGSEFCNIFYAMAMAGEPIMDVTVTDEQFSDIPVSTLQKYTVQNNITLLFEQMIQESAGAGMTITMDQVKGWYYNETLGAWDLQMMLDDGMPKSYFVQYNMVDIGALLTDGLLNAAECIAVPISMTGSSEQLTTDELRSLFVVNKTSLPYIKAALNGYGTIVDCIDLPALIEEADLDTLVEEIEADGKTLTTYVNFSELVHQVHAAKLVKLVGVKAVFGQLEITEILSLLKLANAQSYILPILTTVYDKVMMNVDQLVLNGYVVAEENAVDKQLTVNAANLLKAVAGLIPSLSEFAGIQDGKLLSMNMALTYTVDGTATQKTKNVTFEFVLDGDLSRLQSVAAKLDSLLKSYINIIDISGGVLTLDVTVPGFATELYAKVLDTEKLSEDLKLKLLGMTTMTGEDAVALVDALTLGEIIEVLEAVNPTKLYNAFLNIGYVEAALDKVSGKLGYNLAGVTLDDMVNVAANVPSMERICEIIENKTGKDILAYIEKLAIKVDGLVNRAEQISAIEKIMDKVGAKLNVDLTAISAESILDRAKDAPISETISNVIASKIGVDIRDVLNAYTVDELYDLALEKASTKEGAFNKVKNYALALADKLPDEVMNVSLSDAYKGDGAFGGAKSITVNAKALLEKALTKVFNKIDSISVESGAVNKVLDQADKVEKALDLILSRINGSTLTVGLDLTVRFQDLYEIVYMSRDGEKELFKAYLPVGADLSIFKNESDVTGYEFKGWTDAQGNEIMTMPTADTVVYADRNAVKVDFEDADGTHLGTIMMESGDTLADYAATMETIEAMVKLPTDFNTNLLDSFTISWLENNALVTEETQFEADTTLVATTSPDYFLFFDIDVDYDVTESNGEYVITINGDLPAAFGLNLDNAHLLKRANGTDKVTLKVVIANGEFTFLTLEDATLAQLYSDTAENVVFSYATATELPESFAGTVYEDAEDTAYYTFDILTDDVKFADAFAAPIRIQVPYAEALENAIDMATRVHTIANGVRELVDSEVIVTDTASYVVINAPHFSDYVIAKEYLVTYEITDGTNAVDGTWVGMDLDNMYFPLNQELVLNFTVETGYTVEKIEVLVSGATVADEYEMGDTLVVTSGLKVTVTVESGSYNIYYYAKGELKSTQTYDKDDIAKFTTEAAFLTYSFDNVKNLAPAGYQKAGKWVGFDKNMLGVADIYLFASWTPIEYTVEFKGAKSFKVTVENYATIVTEPAVPAVSGKSGTWEAYDLSKLVEKANASNVYTINPVYTNLVYLVITDGNVTAVPTSSEAGKTITVTAKEKTGYDAVISVKTAKNVAVNIADGKFTMPDADVYVTVEYVAKTLNYTINGEAKTGKYNDDIVFTVVLNPGEVLTTAPAGCELASYTTDAAGVKTLTYTFKLTTDNTAITYTIESSAMALLKIFNGKIYTGEGDPESLQKNVTFSGWSATVAGSLAFALFTLSYTQSLLWLWILLAILLLILIIALLYTLYINGKIRRPLFLLRFVAWLVGLFFGLCLAISGLGLKIARLFGKSDDPKDYGFEAENKPEETPAEENAEETAEETATEATAEEAVVAEEAVEEAVTEEAVTEEAVAEEATVEEAPTAETATEEAPVEQEATTEEAATEEAVAEEAATEEAPAEQEATEEKTDSEEEPKKDNNQ